jgi:nucleoside-diphosphate-sugar epimerase
MKALFIGGTGVISTAVSALAVERGFELTVLNRGTRNELLPAGVRQLTADARDPAALRAVIARESFDVVVDWIVFTPEQLAVDLAVFAGRTAQYILISSASAYQKPPTHHLITESTPLANPYWQYSRDKIACEEALTRAWRETGFPMTIVRPSHTYGLTQIPAAVASWRHPWTLVDRMRNGLPVIVPGDGTSLWTITHNSDFAAGFVGLMGNVRAIGHAFHITSDEALTWDQITMAIGAAAGVEPLIVHAASDLIAAFEPEQTGNLLGDKARCALFDTTKIKSYVPGFQATMPFARGIRQSIAWFESHPALRTIDEGFNAFTARVLSACDAARRTAGPVQ